MNVLVSRLPDHLSVLDERSDDPFFAGVGGFVSSYVLQGSDLDNLVRPAAPEFWESDGDPDLIQGMLEAAYLPLTSRRQWTEAMDRARSEAAALEIDPVEWVTFVAANDESRLGLLLPQDSAERQRLSLFAFFAGRIRAVSMEREPGGRLAMSIRAGMNHCGLPNPEGNCEPGSCGGCTPRVREVGEWGLVCSCEH